MFPTRPDRRARLPSAWRVGKGAIRAFTPVFGGLWRRALRVGIGGLRPPFLTLKNADAKRRLPRFAAFAHPAIRADQSSRCPR